MKDNTNYSEDIQNLISEIKKYRGVDPKAVIDNCVKLEECGKRLNEDALVGYAQFSKAETYYLLNDLKRFYPEMTSARGVMQKIGEWDFVIMANNMLGIMSLNRGKVPYAMDYYLEALSLCQKYKLSHLEWIVNINMGTMYLNIEEYRKAIDYIEQAYDYIVENKENCTKSEEDIKDYYRNLTNIYVDLGKAYLELGDLDKAQEFMDKIDYECIQYISEPEFIVVYTFKARLYNRQNKIRKRDSVIFDISDIIDTHIPIMDLFDDIYDYMLMLFEIGYYEDLFKVTQVVESLIRMTAIKNLQRKLLSIKLKYCRKEGNQEEYGRLAVLYYELTEAMEQENHNMVISMIDLKSDYDDLSAINIEFKKKNKALRKKTETDAVTKLANRRGLRKHGKEVFDKCVKNKAGFAIEMLDIDYFKQYNDNYGHQMGDMCIKTVANLISKQKKNGKIFTARYGGDEFVIIYEGFTKSEVEKMAEELKKRIAEEAITHEFSEASDIVTISQGICYGVPIKGQKLDDYLYRADECLYKAKEVSRNTIYVGDYEE
ncbi:MAG: GGDEF domain-containing protein [Lachnospiraceae bacterium]|nr:GGDEF domain-containing protein [Lachnospiraceae bacterium]